MKQFDLDKPIMTLIGGVSRKEAYWTLRNAVEGVQIFGGIGSGKTSGSGRTLALKYLHEQFGGLVLTVKPDEKALWERYCKITDRTKDLIVVEQGGTHFFNFLDYESSQATGGETDNIVQVLKTVIRAGEEKDKGTSDDGFWESALDMLIFYIIDLCKIAYGRVTIQKMYDIVQSLPKQEQSNRPQATTFKDTFKLAQENIDKQIDEWEKEKTVEELRSLSSKDLYDDAVTNSIRDARTFKLVYQFFEETLLGLHEKTRSIIEFSFTGFLNRLLRDPVYTLFCSKASTFTPEDSLNGKIILINLPVKLHHKTGRDSQILFKYIWQRAMEARNIDGNDRPVFLWADEAQNFLHEHDAEFQATARSSQIATVYLSQNLPNYYANMGGAKSEHRVKSFLGTLATKIFHANADIETNRYASDLIGDREYSDPNKSTTIGQEVSISKGQSYRIDKTIRPEAFVTLKTGAEKNKFLVEAYAHVQGNIMPSQVAALKMGVSHFLMYFQQNYTP